MPHFYFSWVKTLLMLTGCVILLSLGFWQLHRADEKKMILDAVKAQSEKTPIHWPLKQSISADLPPAFQHVVFDGLYGRETLFLDNQYYRHQFGYDELHPVQIADGRWVLIDRGWVPVGASRTKLPAVSFSSGLQRFEGYVYYPSDKGIVLGKWLDLQQDKRFLVEALYIRSVEKLLHRHFMPFIIRIEKPQEQGYMRDWPIVSMPPERHVAYAVQWFIMAFVLMVIYGVFMIRSKF